MINLKEQTVSYRGNYVSAAYEIAEYLSATDPAMIKIRFSEIGNDIYNGAGHLRGDACLYRIAP